MKPFTSPELLVDSHHGIYSHQLALKDLLPRYQKQALKQIGAEDVQAIKDGPDNEWYWEAANNLEGVTFRTPTGQKFSIVSNEDIWLVPACFMRKKEYEDWII
jgi:hypothetical protein